MYERADVQEDRLNYENVRPFCNMTAFMKLQRDCWKASAVFSSEPGGICSLKAGSLFRRCLVRVSTATSCSGDERALKRIRNEVDSQRAKCAGVPMPNSGHTQQQRTRRFYGAFGPGCLDKGVITKAITNAVREHQNYDNCPKGLCDPSSMNGSFKIMRDMDENLHGRESVSRLLSAHRRKVKREVDPHLESHLPEGVGERLHGSRVRDSLVDDLMDQYANGASDYNFHYGRDSRKDHKQRFRDDDDAPKVRRRQSDGDEPFETDTTKDPFQEYPNAKDGDTRTGGLYVADLGRRLPADENVKVARHKKVHHRKPDNDYNYESVVRWKLLEELDSILDPRNSANVETLNKPLNTEFGREKDDDMDQWKRRLEPANVHVEAQSGERIVSSHDDTFRDTDAMRDGDMYYRKYRRQGPMAFGTGYEGRERPIIKDPIIHQPKRRFWIERQLSSNASSISSPAAPVADRYSSADIHLKPLPRVDGTVLAENTASASGDKPAIISGRVTSNETALETRNPYAERPLMSFGERIRTNEPTRATSKKDFKPSGSLIGGAESPDCVPDTLRAHTDYCRGIYTKHQKSIDEARKITSKKTMACYKLESIKGCLSAGSYFSKCLGANNNEFQDLQGSVMGQMRDLHCAASAAGRSVLVMLVTLAVVYIVRQQY
ncbi:hypothetical protein HPB47_022670 [Ixodes persulcatus]|uniref:Uncharacterized protein n=1 Tax=Ixodes persulcatus TaxID=34615 RepID=A0AC60Q950_IXOPE|nr:hypothetical protein HPB47_022670 [Ixodes persulcatus]